MTLLQDIKKQVIIEEDSNSEDEIKSEIKSESDITNSDKESDNEIKTSDSENANEESGLENQENDHQENNAGWVDSIAKILKTKKPKNKRSLVLSKAKKLTDVKIKEKPVDIGFQIDGEIKDEKTDPSILENLKTEVNEPIRKKRKQISTVRVKPNILDKDRERTLAKTATRGVVQLFNSVRSQQKDIDSKLQEAGPLVRKRENVMKNIDKRVFLDVLMKKKSEPVDGNIINESKKKSQVGATWNVLRDDFMMGAKLKDWDKEVEDDDNEVDDLSDSD